MTVQRNPDRNPERNRLPREVTRDLDRARATAAWLIKNGLRDDYGIYEPQPLTSGQRRDAEAIMRAIDRLFAADNRADDANYARQLGISPRRAKRLGISRR